MPCFLHQSCCFNELYFFKGALHLVSQRDSAAEVHTEDDFLRQFRDCTVGIDVYSDSEALDCFGDAALHCSSREGDHRMAHAAPEGVS